MLGFYLQLASVASLAFIVYLLARALPRFTEDGEDANIGAFDKLINKLPLERLDSVFHRFFEKFLHSCTRMRCTTHNRKAVAFLCWKSGFFIILAAKQNNSHLKLYAYETNCCRQIPDRILRSLLRRL